MKNQITGSSELMQPIAGVASNPLLGLRNCDMQSVEPGKTLRDICPDSKDYVVCRLVGVDGYISRNDWDYQLQANDIVIWEIYPGNSDTLRSILQIALVVVAAASGWGWVAKAALIIIGTLAINELLPPTVLGSNTDNSKAVSPTYTTSLAGNQAQLFNPIPKICGRHKITPPFAAQPYYNFDDKGDQYYYALFAIGIGEHEIEQELIDDTVLNHFADVLTRRYLPAGTLPTSVLANVVTSPEVSSADLKSGLYVGGFAACGPRKRARRIGVDLIAPRGLGHQENDGSMSNMSVTFVIEWKEIDDFGVAKTEYAVLATETKTASSTQAQRWSFLYDLPYDMRPEIRVKRLDSRSESGRDLHDLSWFGMRAYLAVPAPLNANTAHYEIVMRASEQLSQLAQRSISFIVKSHARKWNPSGSPSWSDPVHTRNPAWWILDLARDPHWGLGLSDDKIDLQSFYDLSILWESRQDRVDFVFDTTVDGWEAMQTLARTGRARVFRRNGLLTIARDGKDDLPVTAYTPRNTTPKSMTMVEKLPGFNDPDGVVLEYFDNRSWTWTPIDCPCPGLNYGTSPTIPRNPVRMRLPGITGSIHAKREGFYEAARMLYRRRTVHCTTELQGILPAYMSTVRWMPEIPGYGRSGDVIGADEHYIDPHADITLPPVEVVLVSLSEPVVFNGNSYITFIRDDGSLTEPVLAQPGPQPWQIILASPPSFSLVTGDPTRERPKFMFGPMNASDELVKILAITDGGSSDGGGDLIKIDAVVDDPRVHTADEWLLPMGSPTPIQDPVEHGEVTYDDPGISTQGHTPVLTFYSVAVSNVLTVLGENFSGWGAAWASQSLLSNGKAAYDGFGPSEFITYPGPFIDALGEWLSNNPVSSALAGQYSVRATVSSMQSLDGDIQPNVLSGEFDVWLPLNVDRTWRVDVAQNSGDAFMYVSIFLEIRNNASGIVQASAIRNIWVQTGIHGIRGSGGADSGGV